MTLTVASLGFGSRTGTAGVVTMGFGTAGVSPTPTPTPTGSGGGHWYGAEYPDYELEKKRKKAKHASQVREAAVEAVTQNYYNPSVNLEALAILAKIAEQLSFSITKADRQLLELEIIAVRMQQERDDEQAIEELENSERLEIAEMFKRMLH